MRKKIKVENFLALSLSSEKMDSFFLLLMSLFGFFRYVLDLLLSFLSSKLSFSFFLSFFFPAIFSFFLFSLYLVLNFYSDATDYRSTISSNF